MKYLNYIKHLKYNISANNVVYSCKYHVAWCSKYRRKVLVNGVEKRLEELIHEAIKGENIKIIKLEIMPEYVYLLLDVNPQFGIHKTVKLIKAYTSHKLRREFKWLNSRVPTLWTNSYFVSTTGKFANTLMNSYIEHQKYI